MNIIASALLDIANAATYAQPSGRPAYKAVRTTTYALMTAAVLALAAGAAQAGGMGGGVRDDWNGVQLNGIAATGFAVESVELPADVLAAGKMGGISGGLD